MIYNEEIFNTVRETIKNYEEEVQKINAFYDKVFVCLVSNGNVIDKKSFDKLISSIKKDKECEIDQVIYNFQADLKNFSL